MPKIDSMPDGDQLEFFFNSSDHAPPHFHVKHSGGEWEIRVFILTSATTATGLDYEFKFPSSRSAEADQLPKKFRKIIAEKMAGKIEEILKEWESKVLTS